MNLYLTRADPKTAEGMAEWLRGHIGHVGVVIYYPDEECTAVAKVFAKALGSHIADTALPGRWDEIERLAQQSTDVVVVVADPQTLLDGQWGSRIAAVFEPGAIALAGQAGEYISWLVTPLIVLPDQEIVEAAKAVARSLHRVPVTEAQRAKRSKKLREAIESGDTEKAWIGGTCPVCVYNSDAGFIPMDETFPSGDDEPPAHPNCECELETRDAKED